ncbi:hypothetical protein B0H13DRAFT_1992672 [Mycena leptocephala]|nr:hypothetical protein B0H13DRAFT_2045408 [Mycena leptocephala]KAJ7918577.1 hypothetical protein B0H13DRAFT_1992672 [Mycena leptocephala]
MPCSMRNDCARRHRVAQHPARSSTTPSVASIWLSTMLSPSSCTSISPHVASPPTRLGSSNPSPPIQRRFSRSTFSEPPGIRLWHPQATIRLRSGPHARKIRTLRTTIWSRPRPPSRHHDHATQALVTRRARPISTSIRFFGDCFPTSPACSARPAHFSAPSQRGLDATTMLCARSSPIAAILRSRLFHHATAAFDGNPKDTAP